MSARLVTRTLAASILALAATAPADAQTWVRELPTMRPTGITIAVDPAGTTAFCRSVNGQAGITLVDAHGTVIASHDLITFGGETNHLYAAMFHSDGTLVVGGTAGNYPWLAGLDPITGTTLWDSTLSSDNRHGLIMHLVENDLGHVVAWGQKSATTAPIDYESFLTAYSPTEGLLLYRRFYPDSFYPIELATLPDGDLMLAGTDGAELNLTRTTNYGHVEWHHAYDLGFEPAIGAAAVRADGGFLMATTVEVEVEQYQFAVLSIDPQGTLEWGRRYETFPSTAWGHVHDVGAMVGTADGGALVAVSQPMPGPDGHEDLGLLRLDADGDVLWCRTLGDATYETARTMVATPDGGAVVLAEVDQSSGLMLRVDADGLADGCTFANMSVFDAPLPATMAAFDTGYDNDFGSMSTIHTFPFPGSTDATVRCDDPCVVLGGVYGSGSAGTGGIKPKLEATDGACLGWTPELQLSQGLGGSTGLIFFGFGPASLPAFGGTFLIDPGLMFIFPLLLDGPAGVPGAGGLGFPLGTDLTMALGFTIHAQALITDAAGPSGVGALTNAATLTVQ